MNVESASQARVSLWLPALSRGGMERATITLAEGLLDAGFSVDLMLESYTGEYLAEIDPRVRVLTMARAGKARAYLTLARAWPGFAFTQLCRSLSPSDWYLPMRRLPGLVAYLEETWPAFVIAAHGRIPIYAVLAARIAGRRSRVIIVEHSTLSRWQEAFADQPAKHASWTYRVALAKRFYPLADRIVGVSRGVSEDISAVLGLPPTKVRTIYNPVKLLKHDMLVVPRHAWFAERDTVPLVVAVGRLVPEKGFSLLIDAFAELRAICRVRLMIIGEGEHRETLEAHIAALDLTEDISMPGWWDCPQRAMAHANLFVLSSWFEGLGIVLVEALACGCPIVSVDCPSGPREVLANGRYGRLVPNGDPSALAAAMAQTLNEPIDRQRLRARAAEFSAEHGVAQYASLIRELKRVG